MKLGKLLTYAIYLALLGALGSATSAVCLGGPLSRPPVPAPDFTLGQCMNADTLRLSEFRQQPVLLFFCDAGQVSSIHAFPYVKEWHRRYQVDGLQVLGIHCPSFEPLTIAHNAIEIISRGEIKFPIGMDMDRSVCAAYQIDTLPTYLLLEPGGTIAFESSQRKAYQKIEIAIQELLKGINPDIVHPYLMKPVRPLDDPETRILPATPMMVIGWEDGLIQGVDSTTTGKYHVYSDTREKSRGRVYLQGKWKVDRFSIYHEQLGGSSEDYIRLIYAGKDVWVLPFFEYGHQPRVYVRQDRTYLSRPAWGKDITTDRTGKPYIFMRYSIPVHIVSNQVYGAHELELIADRGAVSFYYVFFEDGVAEER